MINRKTLVPTIGPLRPSTALCLLTGLALLSACGSDSSPTNPSPQPQVDTRIIALDGSLNFGAVQIGQSAERSFTIRNTGNAPLTITGLTGPSGTGALVDASWTQGTIAPNAAQDVQLRFRPVTTQAFSGVVAVNGNHTAGTNTIPFSASGTVQGLPIYFHSGVGAAVFDIPRHVTRVKITGAYSGRCENFVIWIARDLVVNEILGTCSVADGRNYEGTHLIAGGGVAEVQESTNIHWTLTEVR